MPPITLEYSDVIIAYPYSFNTDVSDLDSSYDMLHLPTPSNTHVSEHIAHPTQSNFMIMYDYAIMHLEHATHFMHITQPVNEYEYADMRSEYITHFSHIVLPHTHKHDLSPHDTEKPHAFFVYMPELCIFATHRITCMYATDERTSFSFVHIFQQTGARDRRTHRHALLRHTPMHTIKSISVARDLYHAHIFKHDETHPVKHQHGYILMVDHLYHVHMFKHADLMERVNIVELHMLERNGIPMYHAHMPKHDEFHMVMRQHGYAPLVEHLYDAHMLGHADLHADGRQHIGYIALFMHHRLEHFLYGPKHANDIMQFNFEYVVTDVIYIITQIAYEFPFVFTHALKQTHEAGLSVHSPGAGSPLSAFFVGTEAIKPRPTASLSCTRCSRRGASLRAAATSTRT